MGRYLLKRIIALGITLLIIVSLAFVTIRFMPGSFIDDPLMTEDVKKAIEDKYHLNDPLYVQYGYFLKDFIKLDFGVSVAIQKKVPVNEILKKKIPVSMQLNIFSLLLTIPFGILFGIIAAIKKNKIPDHLISIMVILFISVPSFIFASLLQYFLAFKLKLFPILLSTDPGLTLNKLYSIILPVLALSFWGIAVITRYLRAELCDAINSEYMLLARAKGLSNFQAVVRHAIRNSFIPLANIIIPMFTSILGGSLVIEKIFGVPGMGGLLIEAINTNDHSVTVGILFWYSLITLLTVLIVDLSYGVIDPRIRIGGSKNE
ncbi:ABC transporter permease [Clostridium sp. 'deep sea']|uniref:ABC transporter permease n=1 Tax=Clostridium sp. 'deep sea' TaxID=2779445 RepID=UPI00189681F6|nr:ABC transporter permease [Clostridium sp. 'deep sea']QOR34550.1 ABC transporter permease [Clostridium sp. 'deep sea']